MCIGFGVNAFMSLMPLWERYIHFHATLMEAANDSEAILPQVGQVGPFPVSVTAEMEFEQKKSKATEE